MQSFNEIAETPAILNRKYGIIGHDSGQCPRWLLSSAESRGALPAYLGAAQNGTRSRGLDRTISTLVQ